LKAVLEEAGQHIPKSHDLDRLWGLLLPSYASFRSFQRGLLFLNQFAVEIRYPGKYASKRQAAAALRWASKVRDACRLLLSVRPQRRRRGTP
jgi:HEPN domain-containing protein